MTGSPAAQLLLDFVNTLDLGPEDVEALDSPQALAGWLAERGLAPAGCRATASELESARALREALRTLLAGHNEVDVDADAATAVLDDASRRAGLAVRFDPQGPRLEPTAGGIDGALGQLLAAVARTMADDTWTRMKACRDEACRWAFLDTAKNRSRAWCSMSSCGNRAKVRAYRDRQASA